MNSPTSNERLCDYDSRTNYFTVQQCDSAFFLSLYMFVLESYRIMQ